MAHRSMYETIMELPLFKGVSKEHVSAFLEKTKIEFKNFDPDEVIIREDEPVNELKFMISGRVEISTSIFGGTARIGAETEEMEAFGVSGLFGLTPRYVVGVKSKDKVSIMQFSKDDYVDLLKSDSIYLLNYANFLSHRVQKHENLIRKAKDSGALGAIQSIVTAFSTRKCRNIYIEFKDNEPLERYFPWGGLRELRVLESRGLIAIEGRKIIILSRSGILV